MMGGSCSAHRRRHQDYVVGDNQRRREGSRRGRPRARSFSNTVGRLCGGSQVCSLDIFCTTCTIVFIILCRDGCVWPRDGYAKIGGRRCCLALCNQFLAGLDDWKCNNMPWSVDFHYVIKLRQLWCRWKCCRLHFIILVIIWYQH